MAEATIGFIVGVVVTVTFIMFVVGIHNLLYCDMMRYGL